MRPVIQSKNLAFKINELRRTPIANEEIAEVVVGVGVTGLQRENWRVGRCVELHDGLHR